MEYQVICTKVYNGTMFVEAESEEEALEIAQNNLEEDTESADWSFGEATADYVED